jgi:hypothetical protein
MKLRHLLLVLIAVVFGAPACGSLPTGKVPVDSELKPWEAPDPDDLVEEDDEDDDDDMDDDDDDGDDDAAGDASAPAPAPEKAAAPAPAPAKAAPKTTKKPAKGSD